MDWRILARNGLDLCVIEYIVYKIEKIQLGQNKIRHLFTSYHKGHDHNVHILITQGLEAASTSTKNRHNKQNTKQQNQAQHPPRVLMIRAPKPANTKTAHLLKYKEEYQQ